MSFNDAAAEGAENLVDTLDNIGAATLRLFGFRRGPEGWTRDPAPDTSVSESEVGHSRKAAEAKRAASNDRLQWVPKFNGDSMQVRSEPPAMQPEDGNRKFVVGNGKAHYIVSDHLGRKMKIEPAPGGYKVLWTRWEA